MVARSWVPAIEVAQSCGGIGGGGEGGIDGGGEGSAQKGTPRLEKPAKRKVRPVVQQAVMANRTWK